MSKSVQIMERVSRFYVMLMVCGFLAACNGETVSTDPTLSGGWIRALPTGSGMTAGFGTLHNPGQEAIQIVSFSSPSFGEVSLHRTEMVDGVSRMREVPALSLDPGSRFVLEPGGYHLMLMMPVGDIQPGQTIILEMETADGRSFQFTMPVERR